MSDDDRTQAGSGDFDDWLDEEPGPDTDVYAALADDDPEAEIADWMAFTQGDDADDADAQPPAAIAADEEPTPVHEQATEEPPDGVIEEPARDVPADGPHADEAAADDHEEAADEYVDFDTGDETDEIPIVGDSVFAPSDEDEVDTGRDVDDASPTSVDPFGFEGEGRADTDEVPIIAGAHVVEASMTNDTDPTKAEPSLDDPDAITQMPAIVVDGEDGGEAADTDVARLDDGVHEDTGELHPVPDDIDDADDTGELEVVEPLAGVGVAAASAGFGDLWDQDDEDEAHADLEAESDAPFDLSQEHYLQTATREHAGLAAAIAEAEDEDTEQVALAAPIPGLESTVVGFDDVVEAEGHRKARAHRSGNLAARVITAIVLIAALAASLVWRPALLLLATVVFVIGAGEFYTALTRSGRHPIALFGFVGIIAATIGAFFSGALAIVGAEFLVITVLLLYYAVVPGRRDPAANFALTITVMVWVGLGSFAMLIAVSDNWRPLVVGAVVLVAAMDIAQYFVGRTLGRHQLSPWVSPKKTVEGLAGGVIVALALGALLHFIDPFELTSGLLLGASVAVLVPLGDLAMSAAKRSLDLKDMGSVLPGHGGFLDRIDGLLFVIPAAWAIYLWAGLL